MIPQARIGRRLVLGVVAAFLTLSICNITYFNLVIGSERLPQQIIRFLLTVGLCVFLYRGANWARLLSIFLFGLGGAVSLFAGSLIGLIFGLVYAVSAVVLLLSKSVIAFFDEKAPPPP